MKHKNLTSDLYKYLQSSDQKKKKTDTKYRITFSKHYRIIMHAFYTYRIQTMQYGNICDTIHARKCHYEDQKKRKLCVQDLQSLSPGPNEEKPSYDDSEIPNLRDTLSKLLENRLDME